MTIAVCGGCRDRDAEAKEQARQTRQLRDATRMIDALETQGPAAPIPFASPTSHASSAPAVDTAAPYPTSLSVRAQDPRWLLLALPPAALLLFHHARRRKRASMPDKVSLASLFADAAMPLAPTAPPAARPPTPRMDEQASAVSTLDASPDAAPTVDPGDAREREPSAPFDGSPLLHLIGDRRHPELHRVGAAPLPFDAWRQRLSEAATAGGDEAALAAWLLPALMVLQARSLRRQEAEQLLDEATRLVEEALLRAPSAERPHWVARGVRIELAKIERQSGATRLFALRALQARQSVDLGGDDACILDAWIDVQLAWAGWLLGDGAGARFAEAEALCERLAATGATGRALALKRRAAVALRQADHLRPAASVDHLTRAQALLDESHGIDGDAHTSLLIARTAHRLAVALPPGDAADACSHALMHAFLAERHPAWRVDALECRLAIQLTYESLPGRATQGDVVNTLERELAALDAESTGARLAMAAARLREGDFAGASALCEAAWRDGAADAYLFTLWHDACRGWSDMVDASGHDREALAQALRQLAVARSMA